MPFLDLPLKLSTTDGREFTLLEPLRYRADNGETITIASGTQTDGASVPKIFWNVLAPNGVYFAASVLHDFCYRCTERSRKECDDLFLEAMASLGTGKIERGVIYEAVRLAGESAFEKDRETRPSLDN